ncbi:hypothetical protein BDM02DRAFT_2748113 [Thelephora ganbajun]|uniref:Uncharacterized protein n=1 Tax=Thelephora ganbajun TaxID=370292 RepID=A0ACB6ZS54_THEGA|nr:hypothetical protein BDM02DRAFT_2748113 [Thelephora ganbajun]
MGSIVQNGWDQLADQYIASIAFSLLYYDYALTFDRERRLFWSRHSFKQWGSLLFFLNRYCGVIGHAPIVVEMFARPMSALYLLCLHMHLYHQLLAVVMQAIVGLTFITRTYALYNRSCAVLVGLTSLALLVIAVGCYMLSQGQKLGMGPQLPEGSDGCSTGLSWSQAWRLAVAWCGVVVFDLVVVIMTLVRTIQINRRSGKDRTLTHILIRDGVMYFGVIGLATLSNIITFLRGSEITRGVGTTMTNVLACVLVSRLMLNLRDPRERSAAYVTTTMTAATSSVPTSSSVLLHTLTNIEVFDVSTIHGSRDHKGDIEMVPIGDHRRRERHVEACA